MEHKDFEHWIQGYIQAWTSNDAEEVAALFTEDAQYHGHPFRPPMEGRQTIVDEWLDTDDGPWTFDYEWLAIEGDTGVLQGLTDYEEDGTFSNIFVIRLDGDGRCREFREWWIKKEES